MSYDILRVLQNFQSKRGVNLEKGGFPIGTIRPFDGVNFRKIADTGGKADWIRVDTPHGDKVHMDINKFNQFLSMLSFGDEDFEKRYLKKRSDFITNLGKIYHPNDVEVLLEKTKNPAAKVKPVHGRVFLEDSEGKPIIPDHIKGHLQATGLKIVSSEQKKIISKDDLSADEKYSENIGRKLGAGTFNSAFNYNKDENKVVKFGEQIFHHAKIFSQYPKYFPIVYGINKEDESILIEKLDVNSAEEDLVNEILNNKVYKEIANKDSLGYVDIKILKSQNKFNLIKDHLSKKGQFLFSSLYEIYHNTPMRDFKLVNFGYNKEGKLKGLDL